ncbi:MAG: tryptophan--tRNA ligase [Candidatus Saccharimonadales bacterium]
MSKPVILTGLRANSDLHIGNYLGALLPMVDIAKKNAGEYQINLFVPDLHSFTTPIDHGELKKAIIENLRVYVAAGLPIDNPDVHIYRQSYIPAHSELTWILDCFTGMGEMMRMTQYKDKSAQLNEDRISVGLFNYPVLMAADILLYGAKYVPVGEDQSQHVEFTRDVAERINSQFGEIFILPEPVKAQHEFFGKDQGLRIKDLSDPLKKMSKSSESSKGIIFLTDSIEDATSKIMSSTTDSLGSVGYDKEKQPGISNLIDIIALLSNRTLEDVINEYKGQTQYAPLKQAVVEVIQSFLNDFKTKYEAVDESTIMAKLESSEKEMNIQANDTLLKVQKAVGLR